MYEFVIYYQSALWVLFFLSWYCQAAGPAQPPRFHPGPYYVPELFPELALDDHDDEHVYHYVPPDGYRAAATMHIGCYFATSLPFFDKEADVYSLPLSLCCN